MNPTVKTFSVGLRPQGSSIRWGVLWGFLLKFQETSAMKIILKTTSLFLIYFFLISIAQVVAGEDVKINAKAVNDTVRVGQEARLLFEMQPSTGLHLNVVPAITLELI